MTDAEFELLISWNTTHVALACSGELDTANHRRFRDAFELCLAKKPGVMLLDLTEVTFFGSQGLRAVLEAVNDCADIGTKLSVRTGDSVAQVIELAGVHELIPQAEVEGELAEG